MHFINYSPNEFDQGLIGPRIINPIRSMPFSGSNSYSPYRSFNGSHFQRYLIRLPNGEIIVK